MAERLAALSFRFSVFADRVSTKWSDVEETILGRHNIQPRSGKLISIETPQGRILDIKENDIIHLREGGRVVHRFTSKNLPEGYRIVDRLKGDGV